MEEQPKSQPRIRWRKWLLWSLFVVVLVVYGFGQLLYYFVKHESGTHPVKLASAIAAGLLRPEYGYSLNEYKYPKLEEPTCDTRFKKDDTYYLCVTLADRAGYRGCAWWRFERCLSLETEEYLLTRPDLLGPTLSAVFDPCRYLPTPQAIDANQGFGKYGFFRKSFKNDYKRMSCDTDRRGYTGRIVINFFNAEGDVIATLTRPQTATGFNTIIPSTPETE